MRASRDTVANTKPGAIFQINPKAELGFAVEPLMLAIVREAYAWGVVAHVAGRGDQRIAWAHVENTGGSLLWDTFGTPMREIEPATKHHP